MAVFTFQLIVYNKLHTIKSCTGLWQYWFMAVNKNKIPQQMNFHRLCFTMSHRRALWQNSESQRNQIVTSHWPLTSTSVHQQATQASLHQPLHSNKTNSTIYSSQEHTGMTTTGRVSTFIKPTYWWYNLNLKIGPKIASNSF